MNEICMTIEYFKVNKITIDFYHPYAISIESPEKICLIIFDYESAFLVVILAYSITFTLDYVFFSMWVRGRNFTQIIHFLFFGEGNYIRCIVTLFIFASNTLVDSVQFRPPIALRTDLSHITTELWEIPVLRMAQ